MTDRQKQKTLEQWKEVARTVLYDMAAEIARRQGVDVDKLKGRKRSDSVFLSRAVLAFDPVQITVEDLYGGKLTCTYDISGTLAGLSQEFLKLEGFADSEVEEFAKLHSISFDEAMSRLAFRYVEAEIFAKLKAGRFLHEQLRPTLQQMLSELLDDAWLHGVREYGAEVVEPAKTFGQLVQRHIKDRKRRAGLVGDPGRPQTWSRTELLTKVEAALSKQKETPDLAKVAKAMNYGGLRGGASALGKLLKRHSINWGRLKKEWKQAQKRT